jgi:hypothetical protein
MFTNSAYFRLTGCCIGLRPVRIYLHQGLMPRNRRRQQMYFRQTGIIALASLLALGFSSSAALAQGAAQDMKNAGTETKDATKDVGNGVAKGTTKAYHSTTHGTKVAADKTADTSKTVAHKTSAGTKKTVNKVEGKPTPQ